MKTMNILKKLKVALFSIVLISFFGCNDSQSTDASMAAPTISIRLADAPGDYDMVNIEVIDVMIKMNDDSDDDNGWQTLDPINTGIYNLLELTGGINVLLVEKFQIPAGTLSQIRLVLGENNTVVMDGEEFDLKTPSAQQSGLKIKVNEELLPGFTYDFLLDFDVDKSIVVAGNSENINLKPVIRATTIATSGIINGFVTPFDVQSTASVVVSETETITANVNNETGAFSLWGVPAGTYDVIITPDPTSIYADTILEGVVVTNGEITDIIAPIQLNLKPGSITGKITNAGIVATASVLVDGVTITADTDENGIFLLENIPVGEYTVTITPVTVTDPPLSPKDILNVKVEAGVKTSITPDITL